MIEVTQLSIDAFMNFGSKMLVFLGGLAALIFVHELGHFLFARRYGVEVEKFALGFGPKIVGFKKGATEYLIAAIPLGGYVKMKGEDPGESLENTQGSFSAAPVKHRMAIAFGGPLFNIIFAIAIYIVVYMVGVPTQGTTIGVVQDSSPAAEAGLKSGDRIVAIDGTQVQFWDELLNIVREAPGRQMGFSIERENRGVFEVPITPRAQEVRNLFGEKEQAGLIGITPLTNVITTVKKGSVAEKAGLQVQDRLISIDGKIIRDLMDLKTAAIDKPGQELTFLVERDSTEVSVKLTPEPKTIKDETGTPLKIGSIGILMSGDLIPEKYGLFGSIKRSFVETGNLIYLIVVSIKKMLFGSISAKSIGGPILIFQIYGIQAEQGVNELVRLTALLSINLGLLNLLPIPILDGGHILFFLIEMIKGRPVSEKNRERASQVGLMMLLSLMIFAFYNDIMRMIS